MAEAKAPAKGTTRGGESPNQQTEGRVKRQRRCLRGGGRPSGNMATNQTRGAPRCNKRRQRWGEARQEGGGGWGAGQHGNQPNEDIITTNQTRWVRWSDKKRRRQLKDSARWRGQQIRGVADESGNRDSLLRVVLLCVTFSLFFSLHAEELLHFGKRGKKGTCFCRNIVPAKWNSLKVTVQKNRNMDRNFFFFAGTWI
jgi:hypothetical protein